VTLQRRYHSTALATSHRGPTLKAERYHGMRGRYFSNGRNGCQEKSSSFCRIGRCMLRAHFLSGLLNELLSAPWPVATPSEIVVRMRRNRLHVGLSFLSTYLWWRGFTVAARMERVDSNVQWKGCGILRNGRPTSCSRGRRGSSDISQPRSLFRDLQVLMRPTPLDIVLRAAFHQLTSIDHPGSTLTQSLQFQ
jgi:hypothetical protein